MIFRNAQRKKVSQMSEKEHRVVKRRWNQWKRKNRESQKEMKRLEENLLSPPNTPPDSSNGNKRRGRKVTLRFRSKCVRENQKLRKNILLLEDSFLKEQKNSDKYRKRWERLKSKEENKLHKAQGNDLTPNSKTKKMMHDLHNDLNSSDKNKKKQVLMKSKVAKALLFHNVLESSMKENYKTTKSHTSKHHIRSAISSRLIRKYRLQAKVSRTLGLSASMKLVRRYERKENTKRFVIESFFLSDDVSRATAGIKETVTKHKLKKQKRYLLSSMKLLYKKFAKLHSNISYTTFTRYRPFYCLKATEVTRDTCLCKRHTNMSLKSSKLKQMKLISEKDPHLIYPSIVCDKTSAKCMYHLCAKCKDKNVPVNECDKESNVKWEEWVTKSEMREKKKDVGKVQIPVKVSAKVEVNGTLGDLIDDFQNEMQQFTVHVFNIKTQNKAYNDIKANMSNTEAVIHGDFSENFACKLTEEIQSFHFGGSRKQVSLHTGILYVSGEKPLPFATISPSKDHSPPAIWAHLDPILKHLKETHPQVTTVHFFSDGPSTQYKQKNNFYLFSTVLYLRGFETGTWSFFESSHGKGAPDGVGGALKRLGNHLVANGFDIPDAETFFALMKEHSKILLFYVTERDIEWSAEGLPKTPLTAVKGTRKIHQITTNKPKEIHHRQLSCFCDKNQFSQGKLCNCFFEESKISFDEEKEQPKKKRTRYHAIYDSSSESDSEEVLFQESDQETLEQMVFYEELENHDPPILETPGRENVSEGKFVIVELMGGKRKKSKCSYVAVVTKVCSKEEDGDVVVMFLTEQGNSKTLYITNEKDESIVDLNQLKAVLPQPKIIPKGSRVVYEFPFPLPLGLQLTVGI